MILQYNLGKIDKRRKLIKTIEKFGTIVECEAIAYWNINDWLNSRLRELNLRFDQKLMLIFRSYKIHGKNLPWLLDQELQKLTLYPQKTLINRQFLENRIFLVFLKFPHFAFGKL